MRASFAASRSGSSSTASCRRSSDLLADEWDTALAVLHGGVNRAILSFALTGERLFLGPFEQAPACINVLDVGDDWIVRAVNIAPYDLVHQAHRETTMERYWAEYRG